MTRAQETAAGIAEVLDLPVTTDPDLFEVRQSDAFFAAQPDGHARHATLRWMPEADPAWAEEGAESFADVLARVHRVQQRLHTPPTPGTWWPSVTSASCTSSWA